MIIFGRCGVVESFQFHPQLVLKYFKRFCILFIYLLHSCFKNIYILFNV